MNSVLDRRILLQHLPKGGVCAEIGVNDGTFSELILEHAAPSKLHLIDIWAQIETCGWSRPTDREGVDTLCHVSEKFANAIRQGQVILHQGMSVDVLDSFRPKYFDWVYDDAGHSYEDVFGNLLAVEDKMKPGGLILGHDIAMPDVMHKVRYHYPGVLQAVNEFCQTRGWHITVVTEVHPQQRIDYATPNAQSYVLERL